jgi:hypothetical protein
VYIEKSDMRGLNERKIVFIFSGFILAILVTPIVIGLASGWFKNTSEVIQAIVAIIVICFFTTSAVVGWSILIEKKYIDPEDYKRGAIFAFLLCGLFFLTGPIVLLVALLIPDKTATLDDMDK